MIDTDKYTGHTPAPWDELLSVGVEDQKGWDALLELGFNDEARLLIADAPLLLAEVKRLQKELHIEQQIVQAFYEYRDDCCFDHCEKWMLEKGHRVMVDGLSEWAADTDFFTERDWKAYANSLYEALVRATEWGHKRCSTQELMHKFDDYVWGDEE